jgi:hypothetical protein
MTKLHVFVNKEGEVLATGPAPDDLASRKGDGGPVYAGFSPADGADGLSAFEIEVDDDVAISRRNPNVDEFHARVGAMIRARKDLKRIEFRR